MIYEDKFKFLVLTAINDASEREINLALSETPEDCTGLYSHMVSLFLSW